MNAILPGSDLTDQGLQYLSRNPLIYSLDVTGTAVTREGIEAFRRQVPTCKVISDFGTYKSLYRLPEGR